MKNGFAKRLISMMMAICMILTICPVRVLAGNEGDPSTITAGKLVADAYSALSQEEKDLIGSGLLANDVTYEYYVPGEEDGLIQVDTENKTVFADSWTDEKGNVWNPVGADIIVAGSVKETVALDNGAGTYTHAGNAFSVRVSYEMYVTVAANVQEQMLNTAGWLKDGIANLDAIAEQSTNMGVVELAMPQLLELRDMSIAVGTGTIRLGDEGKAAITAMNEQMTAYGGKLMLHDMMVDYQSGSKTEYLLNAGSAVQPKLTELIGHISALAEALSTLSKNVSFLIELGLVDAETGTLISVLAEKVSALKAGLENADDGDWTAAGKGTALVKGNISAAEYATLDTLVAALGAVKTANDFEGKIIESFLVAKTAIQHNLSMKNITVQVKLEVVENVVGSELLVSGGVTKSVVLTLAEGADYDEMKAALAETTVESEAIAAWGNAYVAEHYVRNTTDFPETLDNDITYTITYRPKTYTIAYDYAEAKQVPYGYQTKLELYPDASKVYDYTVDGKYLPQGSVHTVVGDVTITRTEGKPYTSTDLYTAIAGMEGISDKEKAILTAGALKGKEVINVRYPDTDSGALVSIDSNLVLTGKTYGSDYKGLVWVPYSYIVTAGDGTDSALAYFQQDGDNYTAQITDENFREIKVYYRLSLTNFGEDAAQTALDLVEQLVDEAKSQNSALASLSGDTVKNNLDVLDASILVTLKDLVNRKTLNEDATKNTLLKECFTTVIGKLETNCLDVNGSPRISALIQNYIDSGRSLYYYYRNSERFINEVSLLSQYLNEMLAADANLTADDKLAAIAVLIDAVPDTMIPPANVEVYTQKLPNLQTKMNEINADLVPVNAAIDTSDPVLLNDLVKALEMTGTVGTVYSDYVYLKGDSFFAVAGSGLISLKVSVICGEKTESVSVTVAQNEPIAQIAIDSLKDKVAALLIEMEIADERYWGSEEYKNGAALDDLVGQSYATNQSRAYTWVYLNPSICDINGHDDSKELPAKEATCTSTGLTAGKQCVVCGEITVKQQEIPLADHTKQTIPAVEATCNSTGWTEGVKCSVCNKTLTPQQPVDKLEHDFSGDWVKDETGHWHVCQRSNCGAIGDFAGHTYNTNNCAEAANCNECDHPKKAGEHAFGLPVSVSDTEHESTCSSCGEKQRAFHEGNWTLTEKEDARCEKPGYEKYVCICGEKKTKDLEALEHIWKPWAELNDMQHQRVCERATTDECVQIEDHTWDDGVLNEDEDQLHTCTAGCGATKVVQLNKADKLASGATIKVYDLIAGQELPRPAKDGFDGSGYRYDYVIGGVTYKVTNDSDPVYPGSVAGATLKLVNVDNEKLELLVNAMGAGVETTTKDGLKVTNDGYYTGIKVKTDSKGLMNVVMALVRQEALGTDKYGYVAVGNEPLLSDNKVSLLGLLRMMMTDGKYTSQDIIELCSGTETTLISNRLVLKAAAPAAYAMRRTSAENDGHELDFQLTLTDTPAELGKIGAALTKVKDYVTFDIKAAYENEVLVSNRLDIDVKANLPAKVYEIYVAALRLVGKVDVNDANALKEAVAYEFLKDYVDVLLGAEVTTTTLMNTAAKLGKTVDLSEYEGLFNAVKGKLDYGRNITYSADGLSASVTLVNTEMEKVVDRLEPMVGDAELMDILKAMVVECQDGETVDVRLNGFVANFTDSDDTDDFIDTKYEAIIIDTEAAKKPGLVNKADVFDITENLAASVAGLEGAAAIMLQKDVTADLHFKNDAGVDLKGRTIGGTILDLNGHTIKGTITADTKLIIIDSTLATDTVGGVTGAITGSDVTILAGTYGTDVSSYLKKGYTQESGTVKNEYYEIKKVGNDITFEVNADVLATRELPSIWLAADIAADLAMNYFTTSALDFAKLDDTNYQNAYSIFAINFDNLLALISQTTGEEKANAILEVLKLSGANGIEGFLNDLMAKSMDFTALAGAINGNTDVIKYNMVTRPWKVKMDTADGEDYLTVSIEPGEKVFSSVAVTIAGTQENKDKIAALLTEMGKIMDPTKNSITVTLQDPTYADRTLTVTGSGNVAIDIDMSTNPDYAAIVAVVLAKSGVNKDGFVAALNAYFADNSDTVALYRALSQVTMAQYIAALKNPALSSGFSAMLADLGVTSGTGDSAAELGDTYRLALVAAGRLLAKLEIDGDSRIIFGTSGEISYTNSNVTRNITRTAAGLTVSGTVTAESISVNVKLFPAICEHVWGAWTDLGNGQHQRVCANDPAHVETAAHGDTNGDNLCDECNAAICSHVWGAWTDLGNGQHQRVCANNPAHVETAAHTDANGDNLCDDCNATICVHSWGAWTDLGNGQHQRVCANNPAHVETAAHGDTNSDNLCDDCNATICSHVWGPWTKVNSQKHQRVCANDPTHVETEDHVDTDNNKKCDECNASLSSGGGGGGTISHAIKVMDGDKTVLGTNSFAEAVEAAKDGDVIKINSNAAMTAHAYVNAAITITGADKLNDTGYVIYLNSTAAKITADAKLNIGSSVEGYKAVCAEGETFTYTLEKINAPKTDAPVAGSKVAPVNNKLYLLLDLSTDGMTLNALRESIAYSDLTGTIKFEIEGNDGSGLVKTTDRMTVSAYNEDNNCVATITYVVIVMGDTNCNGKVNTSDATIMKNINFGETYDLEVLIAADVNFSGTYEQPKVNSSDATYIMSKWFNWSAGKYTTNLE